MYTLAYIFLLTALLGSVTAAGWGLVHAWQEKPGCPVWLERVHIPVSAAFALASAILLRALAARDYSLDYVASYTDNALDIFYRITAFWAGQPGSFLFWALAVALMGSLFALSRAYGSLPARTRLWFWIFFFTVTAFFATLLTVWSNPFLMRLPAPADGRGLNPLLQNPGMIIHPPLLFLGYGGFTVPSCLALAQAAAGREDGPVWHRAARGPLITAWCLLTAGIGLGAWWAYMELGWGGYWAWDPVENASLIPWLAATAVLHTLSIERRSGKLARVNILLVTLTTISGFFATYLVRSGVVDSVHAFGQSPVGRPLLVFILLGLAAALAAALAAERGKDELASPLSREGCVCLTAWIFLALALVILAATLWPVISRLWSPAPVGLDAAFYNRVCLPLGTLLLCLLAVCPWLSWQEGRLNRAGLAAAVAAGLICAGAAFAFAYTRPLPLLAQFAAGAVALGAILALAGRKTAPGRTDLRLGALGCHLGVALCAIGIAFSGPYKITGDLVLEKGEKAVVDTREITLLASEQGRAADYEYLRATLEVRSGGEVVAVLRPEKRAYDKFPGMLFSEVDVASSFGKEVYASVSGLDAGDRMAVQVSIEPMVSWLWLGLTLMSVLPLLSLVRRRKASPDRKEETPGP